MAYRVHTDIFLHRRGPKRHCTIAEVPPEWFSWHLIGEKELNDLESMIQKMQKINEKELKDHALRFSIDESDEVSVKDDSIMHKIKEIKHWILRIQDHQEKGPNAKLFKQNAVKRLSGRLTESMRKFEKDEKRHSQHLASCHEKEDFIEEDMMVQEEIHLVDDRETDIRKIEQNVNDLHTLMRDFSVLVDAQGTIIDRIDYNVENVKENVFQGLKELHKAEHYQGQSNYKLCMILLCVLITMMASLVFFKKVL
jgi:hypothetical protein